jgi:two-component SAPR family response regulator
MLGDSIPIQSNKIATNANIYYDPVVNKFFVCVQEFTNDISSTVSLYSIQLPVLSDTEFAEVSELPADNRLYYILAVLFVIIIGAVMLVYRRHRRQKMLLEHNEKLDVPMPENKPNSICVFGNFCAVDRKNHDISYMFTDKLRELTCLLLWYHKQGGISSKLIGTMLWGDKPADKIKNSRSVIMNHMRKVLEEFDGIELVYSDGFYHFDIVKPFYCDYLDCYHQVFTETYTEQSMLAILRRGKFLQTQNMPSLDQFKSETERILTPVIKRLMKSTYTNNELKLSLYYAEAMFHVDPYNIEAFTYQMKSLKRLGKVYEAQDVSRAFHEEYIKAFGEDFTTQ